MSIYLCYFSEIFVSSVVVFAARAICATESPRVRISGLARIQVDIDPYSFV